MTDPTSTANNTTPALPPPDDHMIELERLLELAKVGTHELTSGETTPTNAQQRFHERTPSDAEQQAQDLTRRLNESVQNDDENGNIEEAIVVEEPLSEGSSSSSEGSGVLVEAPEVKNEPSMPPLVSTSTAVVWNKTNQQQQQQQLSVFAKPSFQFYTHDVTVPKQLNAIQQHSVRNRAVFQSKIHDVQVKLAELTAKLANEEMDRAIEIRNSVRPCVQDPFQFLLDDIAVSPQESLTTRWITSEKRYSELEARIYKGINVDLEESKPSKVDLDSLAVEIREESLVAARKESAAGRRWETECGSIARRFLEERTARIASLEIVGNKLNSVEHRRGEELLETIQELRRKLEHETNERIAGDESALRYITERTASVKQAILEALSDDTEVAGEEP